MSPRSKRLAGPTAVAVGVNGVVLYVCPTGKVTLVKGIRVVQADGVGASIARLRINGSGDGDLVLRVSVASGATYVDPDTDPIVLVAGDELRASTATNPSTWTISGAELDA